MPKAVKKKRAKREPKYVPPERVPFTIEIVETVRKVFHVMAFGQHNAIYEAKTMMESGDEACTMEEVVTSRVLSGEAPDDIDD